MVTVILLFWSVSHEYFQVHYPECGPLWRLGDNFVVESVLSTIGSGNQTPGLHGKRFTCWTILGPLVSLLSRGSPVFQELSFLLGDITEWIKTILGNGLTPRPPLAKKGWILDPPRSTCLLSQMVTVWLLCSQAAEAVHVCSLLFLVWETMRPVFCWVTYTLLLSWLSTSLTGGTLAPIPTLL